MPSSPLSRLLDGGWCLLVPVVAVGAYFALGIAVVEPIRDPIIATAVLGACTCTVIAVVRFRRPGWFAYGHHPGPVHRPLPMALVVAGSAALAFAAGQALALWLYVAVGSTGFDATGQVRGSASPVAVLVMTIIAAPAGEEALFRGLVYPVLRRRIGVAVSVAVTSTAFAFVHGNLVQFASALPLAVLLALLYERVRRLWPCIVVHGGFNVAATLVPAQALTGLANPVAATLLAAAFAVMTTKLVRGWRPVAVARTGPSGAEPRG